MTLKWSIKPKKVSFALETEIKASFLLFESLSNEKYCFREKIALWPLNDLKPQNDPFCPDVILRSFSFSRLKSDKRNLHPKKTKKKEYFMLKSDFL